MLIFQASKRRRFRQLADCKQCSASADFLDVFVRLFDCSLVFSESSITFWFGLPDVYRNLGTELYNLYHALYRLERDL